jgi:predicted extracellular nuclease
MKQILFFVASLFSFSLIAQDCSELFISEYVEGSSNNKAIEIYNPTSSSVDLGSIQSGSLCLMVMVTTDM